jgi:protein-tyrosine phosphatase
MNFLSETGAGLRSQKVGEAKQSPAFQNKEMLPAGVKVSGKVSVLFVCLGNICRSPLAEAAFRREAEMRGLRVDADSAGTGRWHAGEPPDPRAQAVALKNGIDISSYRARQVTEEDFLHFNHILALDQQNLATLRAMKPQNAKASLGLLLDYAVGCKGKAVADPYYGGEDGFEITWEEVTLAARGLAEALTRRGHDSG